MSLVSPTFSNPFLVNFLLKSHFSGSCFNLFQRGRVPIVVGGTGFYLQWFTNGKGLGPRATPDATAFVQQALQQVR